MLKRVDEARSKLASIKKNGLLTAAFEKMFSKKYETWKDLSLLTAVRQNSYHRAFPGTNRRGFLESGAIYNSPSIRFITRPVGNLG
ncbi:MAG: hypothetical protein Ct9H300mP11_01020 [Chloroflexota bacterium]|nr:MAG: hypothetical protein Ct9H300mP11_01020 [Chloroflexota bacterium]